MSEALDLRRLFNRESEQVEWKENVADPDDVAETLSAFANDWANLGGGYVICGAKEVRDEHGFATLETPGLTASRIREIEGRVLTACRDRVSPSIAPLVEELPSSSPDRRLLVFIMPATTTAHVFRRKANAGIHYVRIGRETREARNGILLQLLVRKNVAEPWDRRACHTATSNDIDLLALRDTLQRMNVFQSDRGLEEYIDGERPFSSFVPSLCVRELLNGTLRPRNFAMLLFGRDLQRHIPGAISFFSTYPGTDRSEPRAVRHEFDGTLLDQIRQLSLLLDAQSQTVYDKRDPNSPNAIKYPRQALHEAMINALVHRDYEQPDPVRVTAFTDRIEFLSPGPLPLGVDAAALIAGQPLPKWRNQCLAWFLSRLDLAQAEGQGVSTIFRTMHAEGCPPPVFEANEGHVLCTLPAHPRSAAD